MTGEEALQNLLDKVRAKGERGEVVITLGVLESLLCQTLGKALRPPKPPDPDKNRYPMTMVRFRPNATPWVPKGPEPPEQQIVGNRQEEDEAVARGFRPTLLPGGLY